MRRYAPLIVGLAAALLCTRLGFWQLSRLTERRERNATIEQRGSQPFLEIEDPGSISDSLVYRRVRVEGRPDYDREVIVVGRSQGGVPGVHVVTPIVMHDGSAVLVERLWAPSPDAATVDLTPLREDTILVVEGILMEPGRARPTSEGSWPIHVASLKPDALADRFPYPVWALSVRRTSPPVSGVRLVPVPELSEGSHLSYAVQWFAFGLIAVVGSVVMVAQASVVRPLDTSPQRPQSR